MNGLKASDMRTLTRNSKIGSISASICEEARKGKSTLTVDKAYTQPVKAHFEGLGFHIDTTGSVMHISW
jgi:hypothetical protein